LFPPREKNKNITEQTHTRMLSSEIYTFPNVKPVFHWANLFARTGKKATWLAKNTDDLAFTFCYSGREKKTPKLSPFFPTSLLLLEELRHFYDIFFKRMTCYKISFTWFVNVPSELEERGIAGFDRPVVFVIFVPNSLFDQPVKR
jgi:hypothetical protein